MKPALFVFAVLTLAVPLASAHAQEGIGRDEGGAALADAAAPASVSAFHELLAPDWRAEPGPERMHATCGHLDDYHRRAGAVTAADPPPDVDATVWAPATRELAMAVWMLDAACATDGRERFEEALAALHERFHAVAALAEM